MGLNLIDDARDQLSESMRSGTVMRMPMMARITCLSIDDAVAAATDLEVVGYKVEITDEVDPYSLAVFLEARCVSDNAVQVLHHVSSIVDRHAAGCDVAGPDDGREGVAADHRAPWRECVVRLKERAAKLDAVVAYHEAGHVVAAYQTGNRLRYGGVRIIGKNGDSGLALFYNKQIREIDIVRTLAGWVAQAKYEGVKGFVAYNRIKKHLRHLRLRNHRSNCYCLQEMEDAFNIARAILTLHPHISDRAALHLVRRYEVMTIKLINQHWASVERIAAALIRRRQLSHSAVLRLIGRHVPKGLTLRLLNRLFL